MIYRPVATVLISGPADVRELTALVDTGADSTLLSYTYIELLGLILQDEDREDIVGIGGQSSTVWYATVNLGLVTPGDGPRWAARAGFYRDARPILGHEGFLDHFTAKFNGRAKTLTLTPNGTAPLPA